MPVKDRRSSLRVEIEGRARVHTDRDEFAARCIDLGLGGIALRSTRAARPGELVTVEALVDGQPLRLEAELIRRQRVKGEYVLGLSFVDLDLDTQRRIEHLVFARLDGSPQAQLMRAFVAHADRVPPPATHDRTVVVGVLPVPVISGHTQVIAVDPPLLGDRTVIAPPPPRSDTVIVEARPARTPPGEQEPGVPEEGWLDDEMDTAQFRLLEEAQAREAAERAAEALEAEELETEHLDPYGPPPEHTVVVGGFAIAPLLDHTELVRDGDDDDHVPDEHPRERTAVIGGATEPLPRERTLVTSDATEPPLRERTAVIGEVTEPLPRERTLVTTDAPERPPRERTLVTASAVERPLVERTAPFLSGDLPDPRSAAGVPRPAALTSTLPVPLDDAPDPTPEIPAERTVPFLRDLLPATQRFASLATYATAPERTAVVASIPNADAVLRPTLRALLDATALLRRPDATQRSHRGPRVIVAVPHRTYRRRPPTPWNHQ